MQILVEDRIYDFLKSLISEQYIIVVLVTAAESVGATDGLFNLRFIGGTTFYVDYYAPRRPREKPYSTLIYYVKMFDAARTIHLDSAEQLWERLIRPLDEKYAKHEGVDSFSKELLAEELRDFLLKHLSFIKHIAQAVNKRLQILAPVAQPSLLSSNGTGREPLKTPPKEAPHAARRKRVAAKVPLPALAVA